MQEGSWGDAMKPGRTGNNAGDVMLVAQEVGEPFFAFD